MGDTQQPQPAGTSATTAEAAAALAEIQRRQEHVIRAAFVPNWYWWAMAAGTVAIGAARDSRDLAVQATVIPLAALVMAGLIVGTLPGVRRTRIARIDHSRDVQLGELRSSPCHHTGY